MLILLIKELIVNKYALNRLYNGAFDSTLPVKCQLQALLDLREVPITANKAFEILQKFKIRLYFKSS